jgi:hypothetical protein
MYCNLFICFNLNLQISDVTLSERTNMGLGVVFLISAKDSERSRSLIPQSVVVGKVRKNVQD